MLIMGHTSLPGVFILRVLAKAITTIGGRALHQVCDCGPVISMRLNSSVGGPGTVCLHGEELARRVTFEAAHPPLHSTSLPFLGHYVHAECDKRLTSLPA